MSDEEYESSTEEDFSASEDEWKPGKTSRRQASDESDDDDSDFEDDSPGSKRREAKSSSKSESSNKQSKKRKSTGTSLRTKLFNKYKPPPKTVRNQSNQGELKEKTAQVTKKKSATGKRAVLSSESDSSGDDYLVNPDQIDLKSSFYDVKPSTSNAVAPPPQFDCNAGMQLSDSDEDDDDDETESSKDITITNSIKATAAKPVDLGYLQDFAKNMEKAKVHYKKHKERSLIEGDAKEVDVSSLLAMGEGTTASVSKKTKNPKRQPKKTQQPSQPADTDSDLEEVEDNDISGSRLPESLENGIQVCVDMQQRQRKDKKAVDAEACLKRQLNRVIKENHVLMHKASLLGHIAHGLYLNKILTNIHLMPVALKMLPSSNVYPNGKTEIKYFQSMVKWYKTAIKIRDERNYPELKVNTIISLAVQMQHRHVVCRRDFILLFIILLRAMGIQCRLVYNMVPLPLKPPASALCSMKMNSYPNDEKEKKVKTERIKSPIVSPEAIEEFKKQAEARAELRKKVEALENEISQRKKAKMRPQPSFEEELEAKAPVKPRAKTPVEPPVKAIVKPERSTRNASAKSKEEKVQHLKIKSPETTNDSETKKKIKKSSTKSTYFSESTSLVKDEQSKEEKVQQLKRKFPEITNESETKKKTKKSSTKSGYFSESSGLVKDEQKQIQKSIETHSNSFDDQKPSISINSKQTVKQVAKQPTKASIVRNSRSRTAAEAKLSHKTTVVPDIIVEDGKNVLENNTNKQKPPTQGIRTAKSRSKSPKAYISTEFLQTKASRALHADLAAPETKRNRTKSPSPGKTYISTEFLKATKGHAVGKVLEKPSPRKLRSKAKLAIPQLDGADDIQKPRRRTQPFKKTRNSESDFETPPPSKKSRAVERLNKPDRQVLSPDVGGDEEDFSPSKGGKRRSINMWVEVYCELEDQWVDVDLFKGRVNAVDSIRKSVASSNLAYVFAFNNDSTLKDVTPRYCSQWAATLKKCRVEQAWLDEAIQKYVTKKPTQRDLTEDMDLRRIHLDKPMPTAISEYKDHPLYALERHLLKFQVLYPPNALTLGFVRGEPVYARECVHTCHSREIWLKEARVVKLGEQPYKIVKARPKWDRLTNSVIKDQPLEIFGYWQTQEYEPPTAENGLVPRNAYGNVELFKECMLPKKTVHLHLPGLNRVCKKLGIDCASAVIGFDFHQGSCHPLYDGFVVCEEFAETVVDAWNKDQEETERKEQNKYEVRVYGNWKKLIKGLLIRERLKLKYNF